MLKFYVMLWLFIPGEPPGEPTKTEVATLEECTGAVALHATKNRDTIPADGAYVAACRIERTSEF